MKHDLSKVKKVLLVEANDMRRWVGKFVAPEVHIPPVALLSLSAHAKKAHPRLTFRIAETSLDAPDDAAFLKLLDDARPDLVGVRGVNAFLDEYAHIAELVKKWGDVPVLGGGPIATSMKGRLLDRAPGFDALIKSEGEATFAHLLSGAAWPSVPGIYYREGGEVRETPDRDYIPDLDVLPFPDYSLVDLGVYERHLSYAYNHRRQGVMITSRGCPFRCTYCFTFTGKTPRLRSAANIFAEMSALARDHGVRDFYFVDDIFNIDKRRALEVFAAMRAAKTDWRLYFVNGLRADIMDHEFVDRMVEAGGIWVTYAVETATPALQELTKRRMNIDKARDIILYTQDKGIVVNVNTMFGFPTETAADAQRTLDWIGGLRRPSLLPYHFCLRGYEGCEIVEQAEAAGWDRSAFLADNRLSYNDLPSGSPTFSRADMIAHVIQFHERFGMANPAHLRESLNLLRKADYTDRDLTEMYSVLQNRPITRVDEITAVSQPA